MKTLDITKLRSVLTSQDLQSRLAELHNKFGKEFNIKFKKITLKVKMQKEKNLAGTITYWTIFSEDLTRRFQTLSLKFFDINEKILNDNVYIANINKTASISGSSIIEFVNQLCDYLGVHKSYLHDGATVDCENYRINLSFLKLIEKGKTFYMSHGFIPTGGVNLYYSIYDASEIQRLNRIKAVLDNTKKIKTADLEKTLKSIIEFCSKILLNGKYENIKIWQYDIHSGKEFYYFADFSEVVGIIKKLSYSLKIFSEFNLPVLNQLLIKLSNVACEYYAELYDLLVDHDFIFIEFKSKKSASLLPFMKPYKILHEIQFGLYQRTNKNALIL